MMKLELDICAWKNEHLTQCLLKCSSSVFLWGFCLVFFGHSPAEHVRVHNPQPPSAAITISFWHVSRESLVLHLGLGRPILDFVLVTKLSARKQHPIAGN